MRFVKPADHVGDRHRSRPVASIKKRKNKVLVGAQVVASIDDRRRNTMSQPQRLLLSINSHGHIRRVTTAAAILP